MLILGSLKLIFEALKQFNIEFVFEYLLCAVLSKKMHGFQSVLSCEIFGANGYQTVCNTLCTRAINKFCVRSNENNSTLKLSLRVCGQDCFGSFNLLNNNWKI